MSHPTLTPEAKSALRGTIARLRKELLQGFREAADTAYLLKIRLKTSGLREAPMKRRERLEAWIDEQIRAVPEAEQKKAKPEELRERFLSQAVKEAASTLLNRLILLRIMEAMSAGKPRAERLVAHDVITKGWMSPAYKEFREYAPGLCGDKTEGYVTLLSLVFDELALDLPGLYGNVGLTRLFPIPPATLRSVVEALNEKELDSAWTDDTTLGWVYQYWNDPDREALDAKLNDGGKIEPHEIASKTQMFTERYMVEWLLQNSLGLQWLCICRKHGWTPDAESVLGDLDRRRGEWRGLRDKGEVALDALMPISGELEEHWKYYVPQPIPEDMVTKVTGTVRELKILDPACGSGHFLVIAFDLLVALYKEEARHLDQVWSNKTIAEGILENNLHGVDIDPWAIQIAVAGLFVKARAFASNTRFKKINLVAPALRLARLPANDPAVEVLRKDLRVEAGIPDDLTNMIIKGLAGVDHLGTLLRVDQTIEDALRAYERPVSARAATGDLFSRKFPAAQATLPIDDARATILDKLEPFLAHHAQENDLGLRLDGEQIAAGVRFVRMMREGRYDVVVGNPPYQGTSKMVDAAYIAKTYPRGKADLYSAFFDRGLDLCTRGGVLAMVTLQGWMFLRQFAPIRERMVSCCDVRALVDLRWCAFEQMRHHTVAMFVVRNEIAGGESSVALCPTERTERDESTPALYRKRAELLTQVGRHEFSSREFVAIEGAPLVYWWSSDFLARYVLAPKLATRAPVRQGMATGENTRFLRTPWEVRSSAVWRARSSAPQGASPNFPWVPYIKGADGKTWFEPLREVVRWSPAALSIKLMERDGAQVSRPQNDSYYFRIGVAFTSTPSVPTSSETASSW